MKSDPEAEIRAVLEPSYEAVGRIVAGALVVPPPQSPVSSPLIFAVGVVAAMAIFVTYTRQEATFTGPLPVVPVAEVAIRVSNSGNVMLVKGPAGRTLVVNRPAGAQG